MCMLLVHMIWNVIDKIAIYKLKKPTCIYHMFYSNKTNSAYVLPRNRYKQITKTY